MVKTLQSGEVLDIIKAKLPTASGKGWGGGAAPPDF